MTSMAKVSQPKILEVSEDEITAIKVAAKIDPWIWISPVRNNYCRVIHTRMPFKGYWCTREEKHPGPHICTVHHGDRITGFDIGPNIECVWYDTRENPKRYEE